ncbi:MAG: ATP-dependent DNA ligase, partial [Limisphaerales bacterium]
HLNGDCLHWLTLTMRKERLAKLLEGGAPCLRLSASLEGKPEAMLSFCREHRLEGVVAKKRDSVYRPGDRCASWVKFKTQQEATFLWRFDWFRWLHQRPTSHTCPRSDRATLGVPELLRTKLSASFG